MRISNFGTVVLSLLLTGCGAMDIKEFEETSPRLVLEDYFAGKTRAWGIFEDRFGRVRRQFTVDIDGVWDGETLVLDERFEYRDGERDRRVWTIAKAGARRYEGRADDVVGLAVGEAHGSVLNWRYEMDLKIGGSTWRVAFDDRMFLQPDNVLINRARVSKWGFELGTVTLFFRKPARRSANANEAPVAFPTQPRVAEPRTAANR